MRRRRYLLVASLLVAMAYGPTVLADDASLLGPQAVGSPAGQGPASSQSSSTLQPASPSSLQPGGAAASGFGPSTDPNQLQGNMPSDQTKLMITAEGDQSHLGNEQSGSSGIPWWTWVIAGLIVIGIAVVGWKDYRRKA